MSDGGVFGLFGLFPSFANDRFAFFVRLNEFAEQMNKNNLLGRTKTNRFAGFVRYHFFGRNFVRAHVGLTLVETFYKKIVAIQLNGQVNGINSWTFEAEIGAGTAANGEDFFVGVDGLDGFS